VAILDELGAWLSFWILDYCRKQTTDKQPSPAQPGSDKLYNYVIISLAD
jgi:hypothetical protein